MEQLFEALGIDPQVILANIISFLLLLWLLSKVLVRPISGILKQRREEIETSFRRIEEENARIQEEQVRLQRRLDEIEAEARARIEQAGAEGARLKEQIIAEAQAEVERMRRRGVQEIEQERDKALTQIREHVADLVAQATERIIGQTLDDPGQRSLIQRTLEQIAGERG